MDIITQKISTQASLHPKFKFFKWNEKDYQENRKDQLKLTCT